MIFTAFLEIPASCAGGGLGIAAWGPRWGIGRMCRLQRHQTKQNRAFSALPRLHTQIKPTSLHFPKCCTAAKFWSWTIIKSEKRSPAR